MRGSKTIKKRVEAERIRAVVRRIETTLLLAEELAADLPPSLPAFSVRSRIRQVVGFLAVWRDR